MIIISHRGYWLQANEKNTTTAFTRSFNLQLGTETDVRDYCGELVIAHDIPSGDEITLPAFLDLLHKQPLPLALNIKADGLASALQTAMSHYNKNHWFVFDMSIPDMRAHLASGNPVFARVSEVEPEPVFLNSIAGIWLDAFYNDDWQLERIESWLNQGKRVCLVSPELHKRDYQPLWQRLREKHYLNDSRLMLCTDFPEEAQQFFRIPL